MKKQEHTELYENLASSKMGKKKKKMNKPPYRYLLDTPRNYDEWKTIKILKLVNNRGELVFSHF